MKSIQNNPKARALLNIGLGLYVLSNVINNLINSKATYFMYFGLVFSVLLIILGIYNYFILYKDLQIYKNKTFGYFSLIIGLLFFISTSMNFFYAKYSIFSTILSSTASAIIILLGILLLK